MSFGNAFASLHVVEDEEDKLAQPNKNAPKGKNVGHGREPQQKKVVVKAKPQQNIGQSAMVEGGYEVFSHEKPKEKGGFASKGRFGQSDNADRRGGRGRGRGGKGGAGYKGGDEEPGHNRPRRDGEEGERKQGNRGRGRGNRDGEEGGERRRGGGRGQRPRTANPDAQDGDATTDLAGKGTGEVERKGYKGKAREDYHPYDRKSGTGRGKRDQQKQGGGRGQWGDAKQDKPEGEEPVKEEPEKEEEEEATAAVEEVKKEEPEPEEEDVGISLDDFLNSRKKTNVAETREHIKITDKKIQEDTTERQRTEVLAKKNVGGEQHAVRPGQGAELMGFMEVQDEEFESRDRRGGRGGGRGGNRGQDRQDRPRTQGRGQRKGGKVVKLTEDEFPTL